MNPILFFSMQVFGMLFIALYILVAIHRKYPDWVIYLNFFFFLCVFAATANRIFDLFS